MHVLLLGQRSAERIRVQRLLSDADATVDVCSDGDWVCSGMEGHCPLDGGDIDVAVAVASRGRRFDAQGIACVQRARIPIVTVGATASDPVLRFATESLARIDGRVIVAVEAAAADATGHLRAVEEALTTRLRTDEMVSTHIRRMTGSIHVALHGDVAPDRVSAIVDVARAAVRAYDPHVPVIDVSFSPAVT